MSETRPVGRPKGEDSTIVNIRVPHSLLARLDRYLDHRERSMSHHINRGTIMRNALQAFLDVAGY